MMWRTHAGDAAPDPNETLPRQPILDKPAYDEVLVPFLADLPRHLRIAGGFASRSREKDPTYAATLRRPPPRGRLSGGLLDRTERVLHEDDREPYRDCVTPATKSMMHVYVAYVNRNTHNEKNIDARGAIHYVLATFFDIVESESARNQARVSRRSSGEAGVQSRQITRFMCEMGSRVGRCFYAWRALGTSKTLVADSIARR